MTPKKSEVLRVSQLAVQASCVRSTRNLQKTFIPNPASIAFKTNSEFLVPAVLNFCKVGPPAAQSRYPKGLLLNDIIRPIGELRHVTGLRLNKLC